MFLFPGDHNDDTDDGDGGHDGDSDDDDSIYKDGDYFSGPSVENALVHDRELWGRPNSPFQPDQIMLIMI